MAAALPTRGLVPLAGTSRLVRPVDFAPYYELWINGSKLKDDVLRQIAGMTIEMSVDGADQVTLDVQPVTGLRRVRNLLDGHVLAEGNSLEVWAGNGRGPLVSMGRYDLQVSPPRGDERGRRLEVIGYSAAAKLLRYEAPWRFGADVGDTEIVQRMATAAGLAHEVSPTLPRKRGRVKEAGRSDFEFLDEIAATARNERGTDFRWYVRWDPTKRGGRGADVLTFDPYRLDSSAEKYVFRYEPEDDLASTLRRWSIEPAMGDTPTRVSVVYLDRLAGEEREVVAEVADPNADPTVLWTGAVAGLEGIDQEVKDGAAVRLQAIGEGTEASPLEFLAFEDEGEALDFARRWFRQRQYAFAHADFAVIGMERLRPWDVHAYRGMDARWDGDYMTTSVRHRWGTGSVYFCELAANRVPAESSFPVGGAS
ncbi:MAG: hypothetical protein ABIL09_16650 [Gemmatimonadota bacterium]